MILITCGSDVLFQNSSIVVKMTIQEHLRELPEVRDVDICLLGCSCTGVLATPDAEGR